MTRYVAHIMSRKKSKAVKNHPHPNPKQDRGEEKSSNRHVYIEPGVQIDLVQDLKDKRDSAQTENTTHNKKQLVWTKISALLIFIYAGLTFWLVCLSGTAIKDTRKHFTADQRPYVWPANIAPLPMKVNERLMANVLPCQLW